MIKNILAPKAKSKTGNLTLFFQRGTCLLSCASNLCWNPLSDDGEQNKKKQQQNNNKKLKNKETKKQTNKQTKKPKTNKKQKNKTNKETGYH